MQYFYLKQIKDELYLPRKVVMREENTIEVRVSFQRNSGRFETLPKACFVAPLTNYLGTVPRLKY